tara:strand:+ start:42411 stop:43523 length:1113 start_codon:yes stop_codon:yes gene_type:complete
MRTKRLFIISAINITSGGPGRILNECLENSTKILDKFKLIALINDKKYIHKYTELSQKITFICFPKSNKNWLFRIFYEYIYFFQFSRKFSIDIWLSLHDCSPFVKSKKQFVYCHNPDIFSKFRFSYLIHDPLFVIRKYLYRFVYLINIKSNCAVIVQQDWIRKEFFKIFKLKNIIVAKPSIESLTKAKNKINSNNIKTFYYPSFPRSFKNHEVICNAVEILENKYKWEGEIIFTIKGNENKYAKNLWKRFNHLKTITWVGIQKAKDNYTIFKKVDCLLFPSRLETWGLPITEAKILDLPIIVSDLPYAHETVGDCRKVKFINPDDPKKLANILFLLTKGKQILNISIAKKIDNPHTKNWDELFQIVCNNY